MILFSFYMNKSSQYRRDADQIFLSPISEQRGQRRSRWTCLERRRRMAHDEYINEQLGWDDENDLAKSASYDE